MAPNGTNGQGSANSGFGEVELTKGAMSWRSVPVSSVSKVAVTSRATSLLSVSVCSASSLCWSISAPGGGVGGGDVSLLDRPDVLDGGPGGSEGVPEFRPEEGPASLESVSPAGCLSSAWSCKPRRMACSSSFRSSSNRFSSARRRFSCTVSV